MTLVRLVPLQGVFRFRVHELSFEYSSDWCKGTDHCLSIHHN